MTNNSFVVLAADMMAMFNQTAGAAGFDSLKAKAPVEQMICQESEIDRLDEEMTIGTPPIQWTPLLSSGWERRGER